MYTYRMVVEMCSQRTSMVPLSIQKFTELSEYSNLRASMQLYEMLPSAGVFAFSDSIILGAKSMPVKIPLMPSDNIPTGNNDITNYTY